MARVLTVRGIGRPVVGMYVEDLGGVLADSSPGRDVYQGPGWRIQLVEGEKVRVGSLQLGVTLVHVEASEPVAAQVEVLISGKVLRAGG